MKKKKLEVVRGSGNVFRDLGHKNADAEQFKPLLTRSVTMPSGRSPSRVRSLAERSRIRRKTSPRARRKTGESDEISAQNRPPEWFGWKLLHAEVTQKKWWARQDSNLRPP